ncbi:MAG: magnesium/cobalt transporter CorA [Spirochaetaceae bacterium]|jgi:magnesium transporter|nr:magnesium/cobalt transporter CorA [Spirochaetaceae bacterium]
MDISIIGYDPVGAWKRSAGTVDKLLESRNPAGITWINVDGLDDAGAINSLAEFFKIHPLTVEDILSTEQRPKLEEFERYLFISVRAVSRNADGDLCFDQVSFVILKDAVISFQGSPGDPFEGIRRRILDNVGRIRRMGADYLAYVLIDSIVDEYFSVLEHIGTGIENFEERAADDSDSDFIPDIQKVKQQLLHVRRVVWPLRESLSLLLRLESPLLSGELGPFFKDLYENSIQAAETIETYRELVTGIMEMNLSAVSARMNKVMKVLTIISTLFIPLTFIVGVYGMNFKFMPELEYRYAYPITWGVMLAIVIGMLAFFKRRGWF